MRRFHVGGAAQERLLHDLSRPEALQLTGVLGRVPARGGPDRRPDNVRDRGAGPGGVPRPGLADEESVVRANADARLLDRVDRLFGLYGSPALRSLQCSCSRALLLFICSEFVSPASLLSSDGHPKPSAARRPPAWPARWGTAERRLPERRTAAASQSARRRRRETACRHGTSARRPSPDRPPGGTTAEPRAGGQGRRRDAGMVHDTPVVGADSIASMNLSSRTGASPMLNTGTIPVAANSNSAGTSTTKSGGRSVRPLQPSLKTGGTGALRRLGAPPSTHAASVAI